MRPKFEFEFPIDQPSAMGLLSTIMDAEDYPIEGRIAGNHLMLVVPPKQRHFWSPWLNLEMHDVDSDMHQLTLVQGRFSPNPAIWTGYMMVYSSLAVLVFLAAMFGFSQIILQTSPWAFQFIIVILVIGAGMYWSSLIGQRIAQAQMHELYDITIKTLARGSGLEILDDDPSMSDLSQTTEHSEP
ncbi:MAG: hypothetical protein AB8C13_02275 [Phycisphaerales bacterium]